MGKRRKKELARRGKRRKKALTYPLMLVAKKDITVLTRPHGPIHTPIQFATKSVRRAPRPGGGGVGVDVCIKKGEFLYCPVEIKCGQHPYCKKFFDVTSLFYERDAKVRKKAVHVWGTFQEYQRQVEILVLRALRTENQTLFQEEILPLLFDL